MNIPKDKKIKNERQGRGHKTLYRIKEDINILDNSYCNVIKLCFIYQLAKHQRVKAITKINISYNKYVYFRLCTICKH